jgi:general stress protein YciG
MMTESIENMEQVGLAGPKSATLPRARRGFAAMDPALVKAISSRGGIAAHVDGTAHEFTSEEARAAGRKGGLATRRSAHASRTTNCHVAVRTR